MANKLSEIRISYQNEHLRYEHMPEDPIELFSVWFNQAIKSDIIEPNGMTLATTDEKGRPSARMVLLKKYDSSGFIFYSNYYSIKGKQLDQNPFAALVFWWDVFARQVRIEGQVEKISARESDMYFKSRPQGHQLGAVASRQSQPVPDDTYLLREYETLRKKYKGKKIFRPEFWGGYRLKPEMIEFWQGRKNRLHDRFRYSRYNSHKWKIERLAP